MSVQKPKPKHEPESGYWPYAAEDEESETSSAAQSFYKIEVEVTINDLLTVYTFVLQVRNIDEAMILINNWISKKTKEQEHRDGEATQVIMMLKSGVIIPCFRIIDREFSEAYRD